MSEYESLLVEEKDHVGTITINRPDVLNALSPVVLKELHAAVTDMRGRDVRAVVFQGAGPKAFIAGADIAAMQSMTPHEALEFSRLGQSLTLAIEEAPFISVARIQGYALGGGCELAMACDIVVASKKAVFGQPEVDLGLIAGFGGTQRLVRRVGLSVAMDVLCGARKLSGEEAFQFGLVSRLTEPEGLDDEINRTLKGIKRAAPQALRETKRLVHDALEMPFSQGLSAEATGFAICFSGDEAKEGLKAFLEKRKASFSL